MEKIYRNNVMVLRLVAIASDNAVFERLMDGRIAEYIVGSKCVFNGDSVRWGWGSYGLTKKQALKKLGL